MPRYVTVAKTSDIPEGTGRAFPVDGIMVAVFNDAGSFFAIDDFCPHMGASLAEGYLEEGAVACPWHGWRFCIRDGTWLDNRKIKTAAFPVRIENDEIQIELPDE